MSGCKDILPESNRVMLAAAPGIINPCRYHFSEIVPAIHPGFKGLFGDGLAIPFCSRLGRRKNILEPSASDSLENCQPDFPHRCDGH
jgi:hypothetical protein